MTFKHTVLCAALLGTFALGHAQAQTTREAVKAEAAANPASRPMGEMSTPNQDKGARPRATSNTTRQEKTDEVKAARAAGTVPQGEQSTARQGKKPAPRNQGEVSRAEVKSETSAATKSDRLSNGGESSVKNQDRGATGTGSPGNGNKP